MKTRLWRSNQNCKPIKPILLVCVWEREISVCQIWLIHICVTWLCFPSYDQTTIVTKFNQFCMHKDVIWHTRIFLSHTHQPSTHPPPTPHSLPVTPPAPTHTCTPVEGVRDEYGRVSNISTIRCGINDFSPFLFWIYVSHIILCYMCIYVCMHTLFTQTYTSHFCLQMRERTAHLNIFVAYMHTYLSFLCAQNSWFCFWRLIANLVLILDYCAILMLLFFHDNFERHPNKQNLLLITKSNKVLTYSARILAKKRKGEGKKKEIQRHSRHSRHN